MKKFTQFMLLMIVFTSVYAKPLQIIKRNLNIKANYFVSVGGDNLCTIRLGNSKIQDAIDMGVDEVRIASNSSYLENLNINDTSVSLSGGYATCLEANNNLQTSNWVTIDGSSASTTVLKISGSTQRNFINLENLFLINGTGSPAVPGGGISAVGADASVTIWNSYIRDNISTGFGGGIGIVIGNTDISMQDTYLLANEAKTGGGLSCKCC